MTDNVEAMVMMPLRLYQTVGGVLHAPKDEQHPWEYQYQWRRVRPTIKHQHDSVGYRLASLLTAMNEAM